MEVGTLIALLSSLSSLIVIWVKHREVNKPKRDDKEIDNAIQSADDVSIINHGLNDRMRERDSSSK